MSALHFRIRLFIGVRMFGTLRKMGLASEDAYLQARRDYMLRYGIGEE